MKTVTFNKAKDLKKLTNIKSINGVNIPNSTGLEVTNKHVSVYSSHKQGNIYIQSPFVVEFNV